MVGRLSTAKSPQQMFGAVMKTYFAQSIGAGSRKHCDRIRYAPYVAKRQRQTWISTIKNTQVKDVDIVLTTREFTRMPRTHLRPEVLADRKPD